MSLTSKFLRHEISLQNTFSWKYRIQSIIVIIYLSFNNIIKVQFNCTSIKVLIKQNTLYYGLPTMYHTYNIFDTNIIYLYLFCIRHEVLPSEWYATESFYTEKRTILPLWYFMMINESCICVSLFKLNMWNLFSVHLKHLRHLLWPNL